MMQILVVNVFPMYLLLFNHFFTASDEIFRLVYIFFSVIFLLDSAANANLLSCCLKSTAKFENFGL